MAKEFTHTFTVSDEQIEELKLLQKAMVNHMVSQGDSIEEANKYYTLEKVFEFVMMLGQNHLISDRIENAAWYYEENYEEGTYNYKYGRKKYLERVKAEEEDKNYE